MSTNVFYFEPYFSGFKLLDSFKKNKNIFNWEGYNEFENYLSSNLFTKEFIKSNSQEILENWFIHNFNPKVRFFNLILKKVKPTQVHFLCYYMINNYAMIAVANKMKIKTVEMQHGPQTDIHLAYGSWSNLPSSGYDVLPRTFWNWDKGSSEFINKWIVTNKLYSSVIIGNPWIDFWKVKKSTYKFRDYILYSLQPFPITLEQLFNNQIINAIKLSSLKWFIRLHPRQLTEIKEIINFLEEKNILQNVNFEQATFDPLPLVLSNAKIHVTHFSGSAIEASLFGVQTILLNEMGKELFPDLIRNNKAVYIDSNLTDFNEKFNDYVLKSNSITKDESTIDKNNVKQNLFSYDVKN
jgi:hypothetical protein